LEYTNYLHQISVPLPRKFGQDYLDKVLNNELKSLGDFLNFFPGVYVTTTFGTGCMLSVDLTDIIFNYTRRSVLKDINGNDSIDFINDKAAFSVSKEVIQINKFENRNQGFLLEDNPDKVFIKSPAGVFTELTIPTREIIKGIGKKKFSSVKLSLNAFRRDDWNYSLPFPGTYYSPVPFPDNATTYYAKMLLIEPDSVMNFFELKRVADGKTAYTTQFNSSTFAYEFNNISNVVQNAIEKAPDKDLKLWLIPVQTLAIEQSVSYSSTIPVDYMTSHYLWPSGVTLKKGGDNLKVRVVATDLTINE